MSRIGYTPKQAERLKHKIDLQMAKAEDAINAMRHLVTDTHDYGFAGEPPNNSLENLREFAYYLQSVVDRRTR